ncbi:hypothetical protein [Roseovarius faecimaris]|nr:hypothetical protein [Roseovarius faecimaris]
MKRDPFDPKDLILESYRIEGITEGECRSIFLDWALSLPDSEDTQGAVAKLLGLYAAENPDHPMTKVLSEAQQAAARPKRRGGWRSRPRDLQ